MLPGLTKTTVLSVLVSCAAGAMTAEPSRFLRPVAGERLQAGGSIEISWTLDRGRMQAFDEMELVLSLDGGRTFPLRVTREISPQSGRLAWRVPGLPAVKARLALRAGSDEQADSETVAVVSDVFEIAPRAGLDLEEVFRVRGEWRTRDSAAPPAAPLADRLSGAPSDQMRSAPSREIAAEPPAPAAAACASRRGVGRLLASSPPCESKSTIFPSSLLRIPLRQ